MTLPHIIPRYLHKSQVNIDILDPAMSPLGLKYLTGTIICEAGMVDDVHQGKYFPTGLTDLLQNFLASCL